MVNFEGLGAHGAASAHQAVRCFHPGFSRKTSQVANCSSTTLARMGGELREKRGASRGRRVKLLGFMRYHETMPRDHQNDAL